MIESLLAKHLLSAQWQTAPPPATSVGCLRVDRVAPVSIASKAGIMVGDMLLEVDQAPAAEVDLVGFLQPEPQHRYQLYSPTRKMGGTLLTTGAPLGTSQSASSETLEKRILAGSGDIFKQMLPLWDRGAWDILKRCAGNYVKPQELEGGLVRRLLDFFGGKKSRSTPALLILGACLYEQGQREQGLSLIRKFRVQAWTLDFTGLTQYYLGREALERGNQAKARRLLEEAQANHPCSQIADQLERLTGKRPPLQRGAFLGKAFPIDYKLPEEEGAKKVSFSTTLRRMSEHQLWVVCLLGPYRANGPYHDFMRWYHRLAAHFSDFLAPLHIITEDTARKNFRPEFTKTWLRAENQARVGGIPFLVLDDHHGKVNAAVAPRESPHLFVVNAQGQVVHEGLLDEVSWWELLAAALAKPSPAGGTV
jgi:hypothetical protein